MASHKDVFLRYAKDQACLRFIRFVIVGGIGTVICYAIFFVMLLLGENYLVASASTYVLGVTVAFFFNRKFTFRSDKKGIMLIVKYFSVYLSSLMLGMIALSILVEMFFLHPVIANILVTGMTTVTNFTGTSLFVFRNSSRR